MWKIYIVTYRRSDGTTRDVEVEAIDGASIDKEILKIDSFFVSKKNVVRFIEPKEEEDKAH